METLATNLGKHLLQQSWQIAVLIGIVALINRALWHKSAHVRYLLWLIVLAKCLVLPVFQMPLPVFPSESAVGAVLDTSATVVGRAGQTEDASPGLEEAISLAPALPRADRLLVIAKRHWALAVWGLVALAFYTTFVLRMLGIRRRLLNHRRPASEQIQNDLSVISEGCASCEPPRVWFVEEAAQPFVFGLLKGAVYLPPGFCAINKAEHRRAILAHEIGHIRRCDPGVNLLQMVAQGLFWFHPLVWWANLQIRKEREKCCDEAALARMATGARDYCMALVEMLKSSHTDRLPLGSVAVSGSVRNMEERIKAIMNAHSFYARSSVGVTISIVLLALALASTSCHVCESKTCETSSESVSANDTTAKVLIDPRIIAFPADSKETEEFLERENINPINQTITVDVSRIESNKTLTHDKGKSASFFKRKITSLESTIGNMHFLTAEQQDDYENLPQARVVANPQVLTRDGEPAEIGMISEEYVMLVEPGTQNTETEAFEHGTKLRVTPQINHRDGTTVMNMAFEISELIPGKNEQLPSAKVWKGTSTLTLDGEQGVLIPVIASHDGSTCYALVSAYRVPDSN